MKHCEDKENYAPLNSHYGISKKNIKKFAKNPKRDLKSALTTVPKSSFDENHPCEVIKRMSYNCENSILISPLKEILNKSPVRVAESREITQCKYLVLNEQEKGHVQEFKLFKEKDLPLFTQGVTKKKLHDPGYDNDSQTDNEQIKNGIEYTEREMMKALKNYKRKDVRNIKKFEGDIIMNNTMHRIY